MKVAPAEKKAKSLPSQLLKPKAFKAGAAVTKKKETFMKGLSKVSLLSDKLVPKTADGSKSTHVKNAVSPGSKKSLQKNLQAPKSVVMNELQALVKEVAAPKRKSLPATLSVNSEGTPKEDLSSKSVKLNKRKSMIASSVLGKQQDDAAEIITPSKQPQKSQLSLLKRRSLISSPRNSFVVKPLEKSTPRSESKTPKKAVAVPTPSGKEKSPVSTPQVKSSPGSAPAAKSISKTTPVVESDKAKKSLLKRKSLNAASIKDASTPAFESKKALSKRKSLAVATPSESQAKVAKSSVAVSEQEKVLSSPSQKGAKAAHRVATPQQSVTKNLKRKAPTNSTPAATTDKSDELTPAKVTKVLQKEHTGQANGAPKKRKVANRGKKQSSELPKKEAEPSPKPKIIRVIEKNGEAGEASPKPKKKRVVVKKGMKTMNSQQDLSQDSRLQNLDDAAEAILKVVHGKQAALSKSHLFATDAQPISLQINVVKVPKTPPRILRYNLPNSVHEDGANICLILGDLIKGRKRDTEQEVIVEDYKEMLENKGVKNIKEVLPFSYLRAQYGPYEMKRRFAQTYDVVLCDARFLGHAQHFLGEDYFTRKTLTPLRVYDDKQKGWVDDFKSAIDFALHKTWLRIHPQGASFNVTVGHTQMTKEQIAANLLALFNGLQTSFPGGLDNIRLAVLKCHEGLPVPVFASLKPHDEVAVPVARAPEPRLGEPATDEITTLPGREVTVYPGGRIDVLSKMTDEDEAFEKSMGNESKWKRQQRKLAEKQEEGAGEGEETETVAKKTTGEKPLQGKKFSPGKKFAGKKTSPGKKLAGKKASPGKKLAGKKTSPGKKLAGIKTGPGKTFAGNKTGPGKKLAGNKTGPGKKLAGNKTGPGKKFAGNKTAPGKKLSENKTSPGKTLSGNKTSPGKTLSENKSSPGKTLSKNKSSPGKKLPGKKFTPGKKFAGKKQNPENQGKKQKTPQKS